MSTTAPLYLCEFHQLLESEHVRGMPASAAPLWASPDESCGRDVSRVLYRLFVPDSDVKSAERGASDGGQQGVPCSVDGTTTNDVEDESEDASSKRGLPMMALVAFPALIDRYCGGSDGVSQACGSSELISWLDSDEMTCKVLERDVYALAMLMFVEWREFVSALPGCGKVLARETSALWLAQVTCGVP